MFWSDSATVLRYIASENTAFKLFVANRVTYQRQQSDLFILWAESHQPALMNPGTFKTGPTGRILIKDKELWPDPSDMKETQRNSAEV